MTRYANTAEMHSVFNGAAEVYDQTGVEFFAPIGRRLVEFSGMSDGESVLDIGCGRGACLFPAAGAVGGGGEVVGIDLAEEMVRLVTEEARRLGLRQVTTHVMDGRRPEFPAGRFDVVVGSLSVFFWTRGSEELRPYLPLLRPGGRLAVTAPSFFPAPGGNWAFLPEVVHDLLLPHMAQPKEGNPYDYPFTSVRNNWLVSPETVESTLIAAGFVDVSVSEEALPVVVESGEQWVEWTRSHGMRRLWNRLSEAEGRELAAEVAGRLNALRDADGRIVLPTPILYMRGHASER